MVENKKSFFRLSWLNFFEYLLSISILLASSSIYWVTSNKPFKEIIMLMVYGCLFLVVVICLYNLRKNIDIKKLVSLLIANVTISVIIVSYNKLIDNITLSEIMRMVIFPIGLIIYFYYYLSQNKIPNILFVLRKVISALAVVSLIFYFLYITGILHQNSSLFIKWGTPRWVNGIFYLHFFPQGEANFLGLNVIRNTGIFSEAPMFSFVLSIGIIIYYYIEKPKKFVTFQSIILVFTVITTTSTTGLILLISIIMLKLFISMPGYYKLFVLVLIPFAIVIVFKILESKFTSMQGSTSIRMNDFYAGYQAFLQKPLLGNGMVNGGDVIKRYMDFSRLTLGGNDGFSSGLFYGLARIGLVGMIFYIFIPFFATIMKNKNIAAISILLFILFIVTTIFYSYLFSFFLTFFFTILGFSKKELSQFD
ncbi:TPA: hypothetical protein ACF3D0_001831 [Enterococcus faecium]